MGNPARWKSILLTLPDNAFFDIVRNYVGEIKTPFNKHDLIGRLEGFLLNNNNQRRIVSLIDEEDARMLTAVDVLREPDYDTLFSFLGNDYSFVDLHRRLLNLEDRLLVYRDPDEKTISLNPILQPLLRATVLRTDILFPTKKRAQAGGPIPWFTSAVIPAFLSYVLRTPELFRADGSLRKRVQEEVQTVFAALSSNDRTPTDSFYYILRSLYSLGVIAYEHGQVVVVQNGAATLCELSPRDRHELYWAAAIDTGEHGTPGSAHSLRESRAATDPGVDTAETDDTAVGRRSAGSTTPAGETAGADWHAGRRFAGPEELARTLRSFLSTLRIDRSYPRASAERLFAAIYLREGCAGISSGAGLTRAPQVIDDLIRLDVLVVAGNGTLALNGNLSSAFAETVEPGEAAAILQPTFALTLKPFTELADGIAVALIADIRKYDRYPEYEITQSAFARFISDDRAPEDAVELLARLTGKPVPQNIEFSLRHWAEEYRSVGTYDGTVLIADEQRRHLIEHSEKVAPFIRRTLAPGVYLLDPSKRMSWEDALRSVGITLLPRSPLRSSDASAQGARTLPGRAGLGANRRGAGRPDAAADNLELFDLELDLPSLLDAVREDPTDVESELMATLEGMELPADKHEELAQRIRRRLIIQPAQINPHVTRGERTEAKGLDYVGKVRLIEQVLKRRSGPQASPGDYLEIIQRTSKGAPERLLIRPRELGKAGNQLVLVGVSIPDDREVRIPVSKIGIVRKLRGSLFG